jgi:integrase
MNAMVGAMTVEEVRAMLLASGASLATLKAALAGLITEPKTKTVRKPISTQAQAENAAPGLHRVRNAVGLYLNKGDGDAGSWFHRYRFGGKRREIGLGALVGTSLVEARKNFAEIVTLRNAGKDPIVARRAAKLAAIDAARAAELASNRWTFKVAVEDYLVAHVSSWKRADAKRVWHGPFVRYAYPVMGSMPLDDIRVEHVVAVLDACATADVIATGVKLRGHIEQVISAAIAKGQRNAALGNPASVKLVKATSPAMKRGTAAREHHRRIAVDDAPTTFRRTVESAMGKSTHAAWAFMILTASRPGEALYAKWDEIDFDKKIWTCPGGPNGRMKTGKDHVVPLSSAALAILSRQARVRIGDYVFPGRSAEKPSYVNFATAPKQAGFDAGSPHSWRSIFRDWAGDIGRVDRDLAKASLAHSLGAVEAAYRRQSAIEARRPVMEEYSKWLMSETADVVAFPKRAR